jgi:hypothetical protein
MILNDVKLSKLDEVNTNNFILPTKVVEEFINKNPNYEHYSGIEFRLNTPLVEMSHKLSNLKISDGFLYGDVEILGTEQGRILKSLIKENGEDKLCGAYVAQVDYVDEDNSVVKDVSKVLCFFSIDGRNY